MKDSFLPRSLIRDNLACHQSNGATNTAACRDEREGFPKTPDCSIKQETHTGGKIEEEEERDGGSESERKALEWCQVPKVVYKYL